METIRIEIVNKKAKKIIMGLADLNLINIRDKDPAKSFQGLLNKLRANKTTQSLEEITKEVDFVRAKKYGSKS
jgi:hypothetical protein